MRGPEAVHFINNGIQAALFTLRLPRRIWRIAPGAPQIAAAGAHEYGWDSHQRPLALNGIKDFGDLHAFCSTAAYSSGSLIPASENPLRRKRHESHAPHGRPSASG